MTDLTSESLALARVRRMGAAAARARLDRLTADATARMDAHLVGLHPGFVPSAMTPIDFMTDAELVLRHELIIGLSLTEDPQRDARARVRKRLLARRQHRQDLRACRQA